MRVSAALAMLSLSAALPMAPAMAADMLPPVPTLEEATHSDFSWEGLYGGIHAGAGTANFTNQDDLPGLVNQVWAPIGLSGLASVAAVDTKSSDNQPLVGAFIGYNRTFDDAVVGIELGYNHWFSNLQGDSTNAGVITNNAGAITRLNWSAQQTSRLGDYLDLRLRGGWAWDRVLFYGTLGVVVANQKVTTSYQADATQTVGGNTTFYSPSPGYVANSGWNYGFSAGLGVDVAVFDNVFARAEYEYVGMASFKGTSVSAHIGRVGLGIKY